MMDNTAVVVTETIICICQFLQGVKGILKENVEKFGEIKAR